MIQPLIHLPLLRLLLPVLIALPLAACQGLDSKAPASSQPGEQMIPRQAVFGNPQQAQVRISPDGEWISWLAPRDGVMNIWLAPSTALSDARPITADSGRGIRRHQWSADSSYILFLQDNDGDENHRLYSVDIDDGEQRNLTPLPADRKARLLGISRERPGVALVGLNERDAQLFDLYEVDLASGRRRLIVENPGFTGWLIDNNLKPRFAMRQQADGGREVLRNAGDNRWLPFTTIPAEDALTTSFISFDLTNDYLYAVDSRSRDKSALVRVDTRDGMIEVIARGDKADISNVMIDPRTYEILGYAENYQRVEWKALDDELASDLRLLARKIPGDLLFTSATDDGRQVIVYADGPQQPGIYYLFDRDSSEVSKLFETRPQLAGYRLQSMHALEIPARDGLKLVSYLTLPTGTDPDGDGRPRKPQPLVLYVHGGPWSRDDYGYNSLHQWLANRGYAVLSVNYRGSTGFGKHFLNAAIGEFAGKMHDDLLDAVEWSVARGIADPTRIAIMGGSYGGYATLVGLTFTPETFACGIDIVGPSSLVTLVESFPAYWKRSLAGSWYKFVGDPSDPAQRADMLARSPITRIDAIRAPLLIGQGQNDPRVTRRESDQLVEAMRRKGLPVTYINYPDEGHGFARPENRLSFYAASESFLAQCLGGTYQPIGDDLEGSSIEVLHGAEFTPGLEQALAR
jgi:dipeptidyl aminopeptidase/acylaminoacyl peptidase